jgi:hypothetical protein
VQAGSGRSAGDTRKRVKRPKNNPAARTAFVIRRSNKTLAWQICFMAPSQHHSPGAWRLTSGLGKMWYSGPNCSRNSTLKLLIAYDIGNRTTALI